MHAHAFGFFFLHNLKRTEVKYSAWHPWQLKSFEVNHFTLNHFPVEGPLVKMNSAADARYSAAKHMALLFKLKLTKR